MTDQLAAKIEAARKRAEQAKARLAALEARASEQARKLRNGQKIIVGSLTIDAARRDPAFRQAILAIIDQGLVRDVDKARLAPLLADLRGLDASTSHSPENGGPVATEPKVRFGQIPTTLEGRAIHG